MARKHDETYKLIFSQRAAVEELVRRREVKVGGRLPPILAVTVYNGRPRWRAPTDISELIAPVPPPLERYQPQGAASPPRSAEDWRDGSGLDRPVDFARQGGGGSLAREPPASHA